MGLERFDPELVAKYYKALEANARKDYFAKTKPGDIIEAFTDARVAEYEKAHKVKHVNKKYRLENIADDYKKLKMNREKMLDELTAITMRLNNRPATDKDSVKAELEQKYDAFSETQLLQEMTDLNYEECVKKEHLVEYDVIVDDLKKQGVLNLPVESMAEEFIKESFERRKKDKKKLKADEKVLDYISSKGAEYQDESVITYFIQDKNRTEIDPKSKFNNLTVEMANTDDFLNNIQIRNIYGPTTKVTSLEAYNINGDWDAIGFDVTTQFYQKYLKKIQNVQIKVPDSISNDAATLIIIGEYLNPKHIDTICTQATAVFGEALGGLTVGIDTYEAHIDENYFRPNPARPNEFDMLFIAEDARKDAKKIINNVNKKPQQAVESLERVIRTLSVSAFNLGYSKATLHMSMIASAYDVLQDPLFSKYTTLSKQEIENAQAMKGIMEAKRRFKASEKAYSELLVKARILNKTDKALDTQEYRDAYVNFAVDLYIQNYFNNTATKSAATRGSNSRDKRFGADTFSIAYGKVPIKVREQVREMLLNDPEFLKELNECTCIEGFENTKALVKGVGMRMFTNNPESVNRSLEHVNTSLNLEKIPACIKKLQASKNKEKYEELFTPLENAVNVWKAFIKPLLEQKDFEVSDFDAVRAHLDALEKASSALCSKIEESGERAPSALTTVRDQSKIFNNHIRDEFAIHEKLDSVVQMATAPDKEVIKNIQNEQHRLKFALEKADKLKELLAQPSGNEAGKTLTEQQKQSLQKEADTINKVVRRACASMLTNKQIQERINSSNPALSAEEIQQLTNEDNIKAAAKDMLKSPAFKTLMNGMTLDKLNALMTDSKRVDELFTEFKQVPEKQTEIVTEETVKENIEYEQYRIRIALDKAQNLAKKMAEADSPTKEQIESYNKSFKEYNKIITKACASLLANQSVLSNIADSPKEIESMGNKKAIEANTKTILKMPAFKKMLQSLSPEKLQAIAAVSDTEFHKKPVEDFFKQFENEIKPKEPQLAKTENFAQAGI